MAPPLRHWPQRRCMPADDRCGIVRMALEKPCRVIAAILSSLCRSLPLVISAAPCWPQRSRTRRPPSGQREMDAMSRPRHYSHWNLAITISPWAPPLTATTFVPLPVCSAVSSGDCSMTSRAQRPLGRAPPSVERDFAMTPCPMLAGMLAPTALSPYHRTCFIQEETAHRRLQCFLDASCQTE